MFIHDVKIGTKLFLAFGLFIVLMVVSASLSLMSLNRANNGMQTILTSDYPTTVKAGNDSNLLIVFYVQIMPDDFVMQLHRF